MNKGTYNKRQKSDYKSDDFGRGKSPAAKGRHRRSIKKKAKRQTDRDYNDPDNLLEDHRCNTCGHEQGKGGACDECGSTDLKLNGKIRL